MDDLTDNAFLGGQLQLLQPANGYRAGIDPVLLAAACPAGSGARVLDLGCGVGTAMFCLARRVPDLFLTGVERNADLAELARKNARRNAIEARIVTADIAHMPADLRQESFDLVLANPPYFDRAKSSTSPEQSREGGRGESNGLKDWVRCAAKRLVPGGMAVFIQRAERLPELLGLFEDCLGALELTPLSAREGRDAKLVLLAGRKGRAATFRLKSPIVLHRGDRHEADGDSYRPEISKVLRDAAPLPGH